jgi:hypothetical protein
MNGGLFSGVAVLSAVVAMTAHAEPLSIARGVADAFLGGDVEQVWERSTPDMRGVFGSVDEMGAFHAAMLRDFGQREVILSENVETRSGHDFFTQVSRWSGSSAPVQLVIALDNTEKIAGFLIKPQPVAAPSPYLDYRTRAALHLPVGGKWYVYWGGRKIDHNYHAADAAQRFAIDLLAFENGQSYSGDPNKLESYHCWGRPILAPAAGLVVGAVDGLPDQPIGSRDPTRPAGNHVVIDLGNGEYGFLAHFQRGSVRVAKGDKVAAGQELGRCGNSGNTSEPHLHFHLQTTPILGVGNGLPAQFMHYRANGKHVTRGEPLRGETIRPENGRWAGAMIPLPRAKARRIPIPSTASKGLWSAQGKTGAIGNDPI